MIEAWQCDGKQVWNYELPLLYISTAWSLLGQVQALQLEVAAEVSHSI